MIDVSGATAACAKLSTNTVLTSMGIMATNYAAKASHSAAIEGAFALLFSRFYKYLPSRKEVQVYVRNYIDMSFKQHHGYNNHIMAGGAITPGTTVIMPDLSLDGMFTYPPLTTVSRKSRPVQIPASPVDVLGGDDTPNLEIGLPMPEPMIAMALSPSLPQLT